MPHPSHLLSRQRRLLLLAALALLPILVGAICLQPFPIAAAARPQQPVSTQPSISIDYPENDSIFPPGITPPTLLWRDPAATSWHIDIAFGDHSASIHALAPGRRMTIGPIDPEAVASTNQPPTLTPQQAESWTWTPDAATWAAIQLHSTGVPATLTITGYRGNQPVSAPARIAFTTSRDPVGAPIFYRDVPLMPTAGADGIVQPLPPSAIHLIQWRLRDIREPQSHTLLHNMPTCANCHSFSADGKTMGIDIDGPANDKGLYALKPIQKRISIQTRDMVQWNSDGQVGKTRVGFMSQVSPDGRFVVSTFAGPSLDLPSSYYVTNFKDYRFLQVFYPTRGILEWYDRAAARRQPLPGADDPRYVQTDGVWSPDGKTIVFARARAQDPRPPGQLPATYANDPHETQIQYDLYRIPFNNGQGGTPERILGASENGMSNNFPKVSPDGRWIVFVQCKNGQLMRPDSKLYIVPFNGGQARPLRSNLPIMNSWHSFSPNGRWLVFSSKSRSPYTQMYLTHLDPDGNSSPAILIDNATAANRAVNIPEFVNIPANGIEDIQVPAVDVYKLMDQALALEKQKQYGQAADAWKKAIALDPSDARAHNDLGMNLYLLGQTGAAFAEFRQALRINPSFLDGHFNLGRFLLEQGQPAQALPELEATAALSPRFPLVQEALANACHQLGKDDQALDHWKEAIALAPQDVTAHIGAARLLASSSSDSVRNGLQAVALAEQARQLTANSDPTVLDTLAAAYAEAGNFEQALDSAHRALSLALDKGDTEMAHAIRYRIELYKSNRPYRN